MSINRSRSDGVGARRRGVPLGPSGFVIDVDAAVVAEVGSDAFRFPAVAVAVTTAGAAEGEGEKESTDAFESGGEAETALFVRRGVVPVVEVEGRLVVTEVTAGAALWFCGRRGVVVGEVTFFRSADAATGRLALGSLVGLR